MATLPAFYFDSHGHLMSEAPDDWIARMVEAMDRRQVRGAALSGIALRSEHEDAAVLSAHTQYPDRFLPLLCNFDPNDRASVDYVRHNLDNHPWVGLGELYLDTGDAHRMKLRLRDGSLVEHPYAVAEDGPDSYVLNAACELAGEHSAIVFLHCENPDALAALASRHPGTRFLAAHLDYRWSPAEARDLLRDHDNVWADIGPVLKHGYRDGVATPWAIPLVSGWLDIMRAFPDRVCLGTDFFSWRDLEAHEHTRYYLAFEKLLSSLDDDTQQRVRANNFLKLIGRAPSPTT